MMEHEQAASLALDHFQTYLIAREAAEGETLDDETGIDACASMLSVVASVLVRQLGERRAILVFGKFLEQMARGVEGVRVDMVRSEKLPTTPQEAMAMSLEKGGCNAD